MPKICLIQSALQSAGSASMESTNHGWKKFRKKNFQKVPKTKLESAIPAATYIAIYTAPALYLVL